MYYLRICEKQSAVSKMIHIFIATKKSAKKKAARHVTNLYLINLQFTIYFLTLDVKLDGTIYLYKGSSVGILKCIMDGSTSRWLSGVKTGYIILFSQRW